MTTTQVVYEGKENTYKIDNIRANSSKTYRALIRNCADVKTYNQKIWSNPSEKVVVKLWQQAEKLMLHT